MLISIITFSSFVMLGQSVSINEDASAPHASAMLDIKSTTKGILVPRMNSVDKNAIANPAVGLLVFDNDTESFWYYKTAGWIELTTGSTPTLNYWDTDG